MTEGVRNKHGFPRIENDARHGGSISQRLIQHINDNKEWLLLFLLLVCMCFLGFLYSETKRLEARYEVTAKELSDEKRLQRNHADEATIQLRTAQQLLSVTRCK